MTGVDFPALDSAGANAAHITQLSWLLIGVCGAVFALVMIALVLAVRRSGRAQAGTTADAAAERRSARVVTAAIAASALVLSFLVGASFSTDRALIALEKPAAVEVELIAHQWWWEIRYLDAQPSRVFVTANELHLPAGEVTAVRVQSADVIHSLWIPSLAGKLDVIPGRSAVLHLEPRAPGRWKGRCAEFCGFQHAHMEIVAVAEPRETFEAWRTAQAAPAAPRTSEAALRGEKLFTGGTCISCHTVRGTDAGGYSATAPELTHLMSRSELAAGTLPNTPEMLAAWITQPHAFKPGVRMPPNPMPAEQRADLVAFLAGLR